MARDQVDLTPIETRDELVAWLEAGIKPKPEFRVGTEHEKFAFTLEGHRPIPYDGRRSIRALLEGMQHLLGWRHGQEAARVARAAAGRDRAVRELAVHGRQAERLSLLPLRDLARHRRRSLRHAAVGIRAGHGFRALGRLRARRTDVFRQA